MHWSKANFLPGGLPDTIAPRYFYIGIPFLISLAIIQLLLRAAHVIALSNIWQTKSGVLIVKQRLLMLTVYLYREPLGIMYMLAMPYNQHIGTKL